MDLGYNDLAVHCLSQRSAVCRQFLVDSYAPVSSFCCKCFIDQSVRYLWLFTVMYHMFRHNAID